MTTQSTKYDIAISFLSRDEPLAAELAEKLSPQFNPFVFSKQQEHLAGTDGLESLREVFLKQSRLVVILYRDGWGESNWTRVEQAAITDRLLREGWNWLLFVSLDSTSTPPIWLPESHIRLNLSQYGLDQCLGAIKIRAVELGAIQKTFTAVDQSKIVVEELAFQEERKHLLTSEKGVAGASSEVEKLFNTLLQTFSDIQNASPKLALEFGKDRQTFVVRSSKAGLTIHWAWGYVNTLEGFGLTLRLWPHQMILPGEDKRYWKEPKPDITISIKPDYSKPFGWCWNLSDKLFSSDDLAEHIAKLFLQHIKTV